MKYTEQQINNIYLRCAAVPMEQLLQLCLDQESGITIDGLRAVHYPKMEILEQRYNAQAEDIIWARSQNSIEALEKYIEQCERHIFSDAHLSEAKRMLKELAAALEEKDWEGVKESRDSNKIAGFIKKCNSGIYSSIHLSEAQEMMELIDWDATVKSNNSGAVNSYIQKCMAGVYASNHLQEAKALLEKLENGSIVDEWNALNAESDLSRKRSLLNEFVQRYATNPTETAKNYMRKANDLILRLADEEQARKDWIDAKEEDTILAYVAFNSKHPYSEYREEADMRIENMKGNLLSDMKRSPFKYRREMMYEYISTGALTMEDLVDKSHTLTDRAYAHIKRYPYLKAEQRELPMARLDNPQSEDGNTDVYFFGVPGSGKTCVLAGLMSLTGQLGFRFDPKGPGGGGNYAMELRNYARTSMLPPKTDDYYIQVIDGQINDEEGRLHKISLIEMAGERTAAFAAIDNPTGLDDLGPGAAGLLNNDNRKVLFFVIDPTNEHLIQTQEGNNQWIVQSDVLSCISSLLAKNKGLMKKVIAIHVILTKSDTLGDYADKTVIENLLNEQGYNAVLADLKSICEQNGINRQTGYHVGLYPFCVGKFMPGDVYTFDETDSLKILRVIQKNSETIRKPNFWDRVSDWFNS